ARATVSVHWPATAAARSAALWPSVSGTALSASERRCPVSLRALIRKEWLLLIRDPQALTVLFVLPALFVLLLAFALAEVNQERLPALNLELELPTASEPSAFFSAALQQQLPDSTITTAGDQAVPRIRLALDFSEQLLDTEYTSLGLIFPATTDALTRQRLRNAAQVALAQTRLMTFLLDTGELDEKSSLDERMTLVRE